MDICPGSNNEQPAQPNPSAWRRAADDGDPTGTRARASSGPAASAGQSSQPDDRHGGPGRSGPAAPVSQGGPVRHAHGCACASRPQQAVTSAAEVPVPVEAQWNEVLVDLGEILVSDFDLAELLHRVVEASVRVCGAAGAVIVVSDHVGRLRDVAYSSEETRRLIWLQLDTGQGPFTACCTSGRPVHEPDLATAFACWPQFVTAAAAMGVHSANVVPLRLQGRTLGVLNLFHREAGPATSANLPTLQALADLAAIGIAQHRNSTTPAASVHSVDESVMAALVDRSLIEQAKGILAERGPLSLDEAFTRLRRYANLTSTGLTLAAAALSRTPGHAAAMLATTAL